MPCIRPRSIKPNQPLPIRPVRAKKRRPEGRLKEIRSGGGTFTHESVFSQEVDGCHSRAKHSAVPLNKSLYSQLVTNHPQITATPYIYRLYQLSSSVKRWINSCSFNTGIFNSNALVSLEPALSPATTTAVLLDTEPATLAPSASNRCLAWLRVN